MESMATRRRQSQRTATAASDNVDRQPSSTKVQINVTLSPEHRDRLRTAAIQLSAHASMGDIVAALIDDALDRVVEQLADTTPHLRAGRKVTTRQLGPRAHAPSR